MHVIPGFYRSVNNMPVSRILSSQVTNTSNTSSDIAVQLMLQYSINVSSFVHATVHVLHYFV